MKITSHISCVKKTICSFELLPPYIIYNIQYIFNILYQLIEFNPPFVNITYHINNEIQKNIKRIGTFSICGAIIHKYEIDVIPHFLCNRLKKQIIEDSLIELNFLGLYNIFILRGDVIKIITSPSIYNHSIELVKQVVSLNKKNLLLEDLKKNFSYDFCIGVAGYPEKHFEAPNIVEDIFRLYQKIKAGSCYLITQMFFENNKYFYYIERLRFAYLKVPIIPGIKPISSVDQIKNIPSNFYVEIPLPLVKKIIIAKKDVFYIGIEWAIQQSIELRESGIPIIHYYTMNKPDNIYQIIIDL